MQKGFKILPRYVNCDTAYEKLLPDEAAFMKGIEAGSINANPDLGIGLNNPVGEGQNVMTLSPCRSNLPVLGVTLPIGYNKVVMACESYTTQELYYGVYNSNGNHGIYVIDGNTYQWAKIIEDPELGFTDDQENFMAEHRVSLRVVYNSAKAVVEKILTITDGNSWQKWVLTVASRKTNGFDASLFPYWTLKQPHFDRKELFEWATRPPMINAIANTIPNTIADKGKVNRLIDQGFQFGCRFGNTDGRLTVPGGWSLPVIIKSEDFLNNPDFLPKNISIKFYAGSPLTEFVDIFVRKSSTKTQAIADTVTWGDWLWVERVYKFGNDPNVLSTDYWLRTNAFPGKNYDPVYNTFEYLFDNSRLCEVIDQAEFLRLENQIPQLSVGQVVLDDNLALVNNRYNYNNAPTSLIQKLDVSVEEKQEATCEVKLRKIWLYAYIGRGWDTFNFCSQVGYYLGDDKQMRFGGLDQGNDTDVATLLVDESKYFKLDFADKTAFRCYLKGTPFYTDGIWYQVNADNTILKIDGLLDGSSNDAKIYMQNVFNAQGYFMCKFEFLVPAGKYIAALGRHNVASSGSYRTQSTYVMGIANSRIKSQTLDLTSIKPNAIVSYSKEQEVDCTNGDIDVWGNGADLFYIYCPYITQAGNLKYAFLEGYLRESVNNPIPVELFPYTLNTGYDPLSAGHITDKNGFYFAYTKIAHSRISDVDFICRFNCVYPRTLHTDTNQDGNGWKPDNINYLTTFNNGQVGAANRVIIFGRVTSLDGSIGYSNVGVSIKDGTTVYTDNDGRFIMVAHNGQASARISNIYINAGGNFRISTEGCGTIPLFNYNDAIVACSTTPTGSNPCTGEVLQERTYPICINLSVNAEGGSITSVKENATYSVGIAGADLAGRLMSVNVIKNVTVPSFLQTGRVVGTYLKLLINAALQFNQSNPDIKWFAPYISPQLNILRYLQWVGDKVVYVNANGLVVDDPESAAFVSIAIDSLYNYNIANNFSLLSNWQFSPLDRIRILDNGEGQLFDVATYGEPIDFQIYGTNYNQAALNAGIITDTAKNSVPSVNTQATTANSTSITVYIKYDARLNLLNKKTGFWIELYTPTQQTERIPYSELQWFPLINGEISEFAGFVGPIPTYTNPNTINLPYWDTYLFSRNISIPQEGNKFFNHAFCSPNVSDAFGPNLTSGGRKHFRNDNQKQLWRTGEATKSDAFQDNGFINGLGAFRGNITDFSNNNYGQIIAAISQRSIVLFICQNSWFTTNYNFQYAYANEQGQVVVNTGESLSRPIPKIGSNFGITLDDTSSISILDKIVCWYDKKNESFVMCDYRDARDITDLQNKDGRHFGINSYLVEKNQFISQWNEAHKTNSRFDIVTGVDVRTNRIYLTFRPRRINTNKPESYVNNRRNIDIKNQETFCFDFDQMRWISAANFTPEAFGRLRGLKSGVEMITFAAGKPYFHLNTPNDNFLNYYGVQTEPTVIIALNAGEEDVKTWMGITQDILPNQLYVDMVFDNEKDSFSYVPANQIVKKENVFYGSFNKDMSSYNNPISTLVDGKRMFGRYLIVRLVQRQDKLSEYFQLSNIFQLASDSPSNKK